MKNHVKFHVEGIQVKDLATVNSWIRFISKLFVSVLIFVGFKIYYFESESEIKFISYPLSTVLMFPSASESILCLHKS